MSETVCPLICLISRSDILSSINTLIELHRRHRNRLRLLSCKSLQVQGRSFLEDQFATAIGFAFSAARARTRCRRFLQDQ